MSVRKFASTSVQNRVRSALTTILNIRKPAASHSPVLGACFGAQGLLLGILAADRSIFGGVCPTLLRLFQSPQTTQLTSIPVGPHSLTFCR